MTDQITRRYLNRGLIPDSFLLQTIEPGWTQDLRYTRWSSLEVDDLLKSLGSDLKVRQESNLTLEGD